jgi:hypothetical protein
VAVGVRPALVASALASGVMLAGAQSVVEAAMTREATNAAGDAIITGNHVTQDSRRMCCGARGASTTESLRADRSQVSR